MSANAYGYRLLREVQEGFTADATDYFADQDTAGLETVCIKEAPTAQLAGATRKVSLFYSLRDANGDIADAGTAVATIQLLEVVSFQDEEGVAVLDHGTSAAQVAYAQVVTADVGGAPRLGVRLTAVANIPASGKLQVWIKEL